jgi:hypothetical protein
VFVLADSMSLLHWVHLLQGALFFCCNLLLKGNQSIMNLFINRSLFSGSNNIADPKLYQYSGARFFLPVVFLCYV